MRTIFILATGLAIALSSAAARDSVPPENIWGFYEPNFRNGFKGPTCPEASIDTSLQKALQALHQHGDALEKALAGSDANAKRASADAVKSVYGEYADLLAVCRHELRRANKLFELERFNKSIRPLM